MASLAANTSLFYLVDVDKNKIFAYCHIQLVGKPGINLKFFALNYSCKLKKLHFFLTL